MAGFFGIDTLILTAIIILLLSASWHLYQKRKFYRNVTSKLPTIYGIPFIGLSHQFLDVNNFYNKIGIGFDILKQSTGCAWVGTTPYIMTVDPVVIKHVLLSPEFLDKAKDLYKHFHNGVLNGIIVSPVNKWKSNRKAISPFLAHNNIIGFFPCFNDNANNVKNKLKSLAAQGEQDIFTIIKNSGLQLSLLTIMGIKVIEGSEKHIEMVQAFNDLVDHMAIDLLFCWLGLPFLSRTPHYKRVIKYLHNMVRSLIEENLEQKVEPEAMKDFSEAKKPLIDIALKAIQQGVFGENDVEMECFTVMAASYETSVTAAYTSLVTLAMHPEMQERVFQEIRTVFPDGVTSVEYDDLKKLPYLDMFISEVMRLSPPIPYIGREASQDTELCPGVTIPKGMQVVIPIYELHRRKEIWGPDATRFNPDNFLPENIAKRHPCSYIPFSKGTRNCIGFRYAEISLRIILIHAVCSLKFSTNFKYEDIVHVPNITLGFRRQPRVSIEVRSNLISTKMIAFIGLDTLILTLIILLLSASWRLYQKRKFYRNVTSKLPTIYGIPFIGLAHQFVDVKKFYHKIGIGFDILKKSTGCAWVGTTPYIMTVDPQVIKHVLSSPEFLEKAKDLYKHFQNGIISGLILSPVKKWKADRKAISPFLAHKNLTQLISYFNDNANNVKNKLTDLAERGEQDIFTIIKECGLQLSLLTIMGIKVEEGNKKYSGMLQTFNDYFDHMAIDLLFGWLGLRFLARTPHYKRVLKYLHNLVRSLINENVARKVKSEDMNNFVDDKQIMIELALKAMRQGSFSEKDVEIECFTMIAASYDTSVTAAYTALATLAMHPEMQERVFQEIRSVFPDGITSVEYNDLKKLPYLDMFIAETLRLAPPIPYIGRQASQDTELCPGVTIPKGMQVVIPIYELHRRKEIWGPDATRFNPDNFLPENIAKRHLYSYIPFSKGPRNCIGFRYAEISLRIILIHAVRNFKFSTNFKYEDIVHTPNITLGYHIQPRVSIKIRSN
ncbi:uncharacterized protein LOC105220553 [Zeugodacus cucurbitae]|uniref:uncharacterized protein LOC105220553 n=1 Tax=Zeugodacus cucurbitae TaxID=28588 RepID=UPI0023D8F4FA|nr:uncharacterized protein LOC105220553 [Zeugodacus cucurbitae]